MYRFALLDPRPIPAAIEANETIFASGPVYGIEVTVLALAERCMANIDPQHGGAGKLSERSAIEEAALYMSVFPTMSAYPDPPNDATLVTIRRDLDAIGAMAVLDLRNKGFGWMIKKEAVFHRIQLVAEADKFAHGGWPGTRPLPSSSRPWGDGGERKLAVIGAAVTDFKVPIAKQVGMMEWWLLTGEEPEQYRSVAEKERLDLIEALETGAIKHYIDSKLKEPLIEGRAQRPDTKIAVVESTHRAATTIGYSLAPVVVALNPEFKQGTGEPYRKFTICAFEPRFADIKGALAELAEMEPGWGGSPTIGGSPQGVDSMLTVSEVAQVVRRHLQAVEVTA